MTPRFCLFAALCFMPLCTQAHSFVSGQRVPPTGVTDTGELIFNGNTLTSRPWNSAQLRGKVRVLLHLAGRLSAKEENSAVAEAIQAAKFPADGYQTTLIVNTDDAIPGSAMFVRASLKSSKQSSPWSQFIIDDSGIVRSAWQLKERGSTVVVLDREGRVRFAKDGALTEAEVHEVIALINTLLR
ncbi:YtfJ family protein [Erwinia oleae]|uniref:YtfJ family protein n=1 Tax=Erwinia oleae TaxID=796334 RepID=UPI00054D1250|nr:YtfJ family protein [Erwinia oleae]